MSTERWPESDSPSDTGLGRRKDADEDEDDADEDEDEDIEKQIAKEMSSMKRPRKEQRFGMFPCAGVYVSANVRYRVLR